MQKQADKIVSFYTKAATLCEKTRDNLLSNGTPESVADHTHKLTLLCMNIVPDLKIPVDELKMLKMIQVHDLAEAKTGDTSFSILQNDKNKQLAKKQAEWKALCDYATTLPTYAQKQVKDLFFEYEERQTREAKIVYALDRLEATLQSNLNKGGIEYWGNCPNGTFYYANSIKEKEYIKELNEPILSALEQRIILISAKNILKYNIQLDPAGQKKLKTILDLKSSHQHS